MYKPPLNLEANQYFVVDLLHSSQHGRSQDFVRGGNTFSKNFQKYSKNLLKNFQKIPENFQKITKKSEKIFKNFLKKIAKNALF